MKPRTRFEDYCARGRAQHGDRFQAPTDMRWINAYNNGRDYRVKVRFSHGEEKWGFVALTTGWGPSFMLMRREGQHGSSDLLGDRDEIVAHKMKGQR